MANQPSIAVLGSTMIDLIAYTSRVPQAVETIQGDDFQLGFGGKGANQAVMACLLGAWVRPVRLRCRELGVCELHAERLAPDHDAGDRRQLEPGGQVVVEAAIARLELAEVDRSVGIGPGPGDDCQPETWATTVR